MLQNTKNHYETHYNLHILSKSQQKLLEESKLAKPNKLIEGCASYRMLDTPLYMEKLCYLPPQKLYEDSLP